MHVCIHGAGGLGCVMGGYLAESGVDVTLIGRPAVVDAIQADGLHITGIRGEHTIRTGLRAVTTPAEVPGPIDVYLLCVKAKDTDAALADAGVLADRVGLATSLQNTVAKDPALLAAFGSGRVVGASTIEGGTLADEPGLVRHTATCPTSTYFGELDGPVSPRVQDLTDAFVAAGFGTRAVDDIRHVEWEKLLQIGVASGWSTSTLPARPEAVMADGLVVRAAAEHYVALAYELLSVYESLGYEPQDFYAPFSRFREMGGWSFDEAVEAVLAQGGMMQANGLRGRTSMHEDVLHRRRTEIDWILGPFEEVAAAAGIEIPTVRAVHRIVATLDALA